MTKVKKPDLHMTMDMVAEICGYFSEKSSVGNFYNCSHPKQENKEVDEETGKVIGKCVRCGCPVAHRYTDKDDDAMEIHDPKIIAFLNRHRMQEP